MSSHENLSRDPSEAEWDAIDELLYDDAFIPALKAYRELVPVGLNARRRGLAIRFTGPLDRKSAVEASRYTARTWSLKRTVAHMPNRWWFLPIRKGNARIASFFGLMETTQDAAPLSGPMTLNAWLSAAHGDSSGLFFESLLAQLAFPQSFVWGDMAAVARTDARTAERYFSATRNGDDSIRSCPSVS